MSEEIKKVEKEVGGTYGKRKTVKFTGEFLVSKTDLFDPGHDSRGRVRELYRVRGGYRIFTRNWSHWQGEESDNFTMLSDVMSEAELIKDYGALASKAGIQEEVDLDETPDALESEGEEYA